MNTRTLSATNLSRQHQKFAAFQRAIYFVAAVATLAILTATAACSDSTAPNGDASITFRVDAKSCRVVGAPPLVALSIDNVLMEARVMMPGDSVSYPVAPGSHVASAMARAVTGMNTWTSRATTLTSGGRLVLNLDCAP